MDRYQSTILITGGTTGVGYQCAVELSRRCDESTLIIISSRRDSRALENIKQATGRNDVVFMPLDLGSLENVRTFASKFTQEKYPPLRALVMNAGLQFAGSEVKYTVDGVEATFGINHVGHALLFYLLRARLAEGARIVITASGTHDPEQKTMVPDAKYTRAEELAYPSEKDKKENNGRQRYATSKLCNVLWMYALHRHIHEQSAGEVEGDRGEGGKKSLTVTAMDPGLMPGTGLGREAAWPLRMIWYHVLPRMIPVLRFMLRTDNIHTAAESGKALADLAVATSLQGVSGKYFEGTKEIPSSKDSHDVEKQEDLWKWTARFVGRSDEERQKFVELR